MSVENLSMDTCCDLLVFEKRLYSVEFLVVLLSYRFFCVPCGDGRTGGRACFELKAAF